MQIIRRVPFDRPPPLPVHRARVLASRARRNRVRSTAVRRDPERTRRRWRKGRADVSLKHLCDGDLGSAVPHVEDPRRGRPGDGVATIKKRKQSTAPLSRTVITFQPVRRAGFACFDYRTPVRDETLMVL